MLREVAGELMEAYFQDRRPEKAVALARDWLAEDRGKMPPGSLRLASVLAPTGLTFLKVKAWDEAEPLLRECLAIREKAQPEAWTTFYTRSMLGEALLGQGKPTDAEPLLRSGYEGLKRKTREIPLYRRTRIAEALDRLIALAETTKKPDELKTWKDEKAKLPPVPGPKPLVEKR
jgi:hypothetical protein